MKHGTKAAAAFYVLQLGHTRKSNGTDVAMTNSK